MRLLVLLIDHLQDGESSLLSLKGRGDNGIEFAGHPLQFQPFCASRNVIGVFVGLEYTEAFGFLGLSEPCVYKLSLLPGLTKPWFELWTRHRKKIGVQFCHMSPERRF